MVRINNDAKDALLCMINLLISWYTERVCYNKYDLGYKDGSLQILELIKETVEEHWIKFLFDWGDLYG